MNEHGDKCYIQSTRIPCSNSVSVTWIGAIPITVIKAQPKPSRSSWAVGICISMVTGSVKRNSPCQSHI